MDGSLKQFPDLHFVVITDDTNTFVELFGSDSVRKNPEKYKLIQADTTNINEFSFEFEKHLKSIPKRIVQPFCEHFSINWRRENNITARYVLRLSLFIFNMNKFFLYISSYHLTYESYYLYLFYFIFSFSKKDL